MSELIKDVGAVPEVIGGLGLEIGRAQKLLDANYLDGIQRLIEMLEKHLPKDPDLAALQKAAAEAGAKAAADTADPQKKKAAEDAQQALDDALSLPSKATVIVALLRALAPTRYQYSETTLTVRLDMARSVQIAGSVGLGANFGAVMVNAALMLGYAYDYRGAAEIRTILHAAPAGEHVFDALLKRAGELKAPELPAPSKLDAALLSKVDEIVKSLKLPEPKKEQ